MHEGEIYAQIFLAVNVPFFQKLTYRSDLQRILACNG